MPNQLLTKILNHSDVRQNLSALRQEAKDTTVKSALQHEVLPHIQALIDLLDHPDAKTRKNTALLMGDLAIESFRTPLFTAYRKEQQLFVKSSYLLALQSFDCGIYLDDFKNLRIALTNNMDDTNRQKHLREELRALNALIVAIEGIAPHIFSGYHTPLDCILLTNRLYKELTEAQISDGEIVPFNAGVRVVTDDLSSILDIRTYSELLIVIPGLTTVSSNPKDAAKILAHSNLQMLLRSTHKEKTPFHFRIEMKSKMPLDQKSKYVKTLTGELEHLTNQFLINSTSNYEIELRLIENKLGSFNVLLKLFTIPDERFSYRQESIAASIRPTSAAQLVALAKDYMIEDSRTLDPFCGVGTMLIERQKVVKGNTSYGIDFYAPAIEKARINTEAANQIVHYINRNFFDFTHEYKFDEIFTNMPYATGHKSTEEIEDLYQNFFPKCRELLTPDGTVIIYSRNTEFVRELSIPNNFDIIAEYEVMKKEGAWLFIIKFNL